MTMEDIRVEGQAGRLSTINTAVIVDGQSGKEYRLPTKHEVMMAEGAEKEIPSLFEEIPFGLPEEPLPSKEALGFRVPLYGFDQWRKLFTSRQLLSIGTFVGQTRTVFDYLTETYQEGWNQAIYSYLAVNTDKLIDRSSTQCIWISTNAEKPSGSFGRFALHITWDYVEVMPWSESAGGFRATFNTYLSIFNMRYGVSSERPYALRSSATKPMGEAFDIVVTDPPIMTQFRIPT
ncbi:MAG: hypothetical protein KBB67_14110 [Syntrophorhabdus sp.]|nr:hypothetical protein [Syntrophorhabdus sp.]